MFPFSLRIVLLRDPFFGHDTSVLNVGYSSKNFLQLTSL